MPGYRLEVPVKPANTPGLSSRRFSHSGSDRMTLRGELLPGWQSGAHFDNLRGRRSCHDTPLRQNNRDRGANIDFALDRQCAAMQFDEVFGEWQTEPRARILTTDLAVDLAELFQGFGDLLGSHPDPRIAYSDCQAEIRPKARHTDFSALRRKLNGVG